MTLTDQPSQERILLLKYDFRFRRISGVDFNPAYELPSVTFYGMADGVVPSAGVGVRVLECGINVHTTVHRRAIYTNLRPLCCR